MKQFFHLKVLTENATLVQTAQQDSTLEWKPILMKRIAYLVLLAYTLMLLKPVLPIFMDAMAHTFWEQKHMLTVHEVNGKFHVHNETLKAQGQSGKSKPGNENRAEEQGQFHIASIICFSCATPVFQQQLSYTSYLCGNAISFPDLHYPPPKA